MNREKGRALVAGVGLFRGLSAEALDDVLDAARTHEIPKGTALFRQEDPVAAFYVLVDGRIKVTQDTADGQQVVVRFIGPGEMMGCVAVTGGTGYPGTATAIEDSVAIGWTTASTTALVERHPAIAMNALGTVGSRLQEAQSRIREMSTQRVERRIAHALLRLVQQSGRKQPDGIAVSFPLSRQDIAEMTGTTLHTVSRTLSAWEQQGLIQGGRQRVLVRDPDALAGIAEAM